MEIAIPHIGAVWVFATAIFLTAVLLRLFLAEAPRWIMAGALACAAVMPCRATVYYVHAGSGKDSNSGTSTSAPWQSLAKVNSVKFSPGDQVLFSRGQVWTGELSPKGSGTSGNPILLGAYGSGDAPIINGAARPPMDRGQSIFTISNIGRSRTLRSPTPLPTTAIIAAASWLWTTGAAF